MRVCGALLLAIGSLCACAGAVASSQPPFPPNGLLTVDVQPCLKLSRRIGNTATIVSTTSLVGGETTIACHRKVFGGRLALLVRARRFEYSKLWLLPGIADASTRFEARSVLDLRARRAEHELKLTLQRQRSTISASGCRILHKIGDRRTSPFSVHLGATLHAPEELSLRLGGTGIGLRELFKQAALVKVEVDCLDLCVEL